MQTEIVKALMGAAGAVGGATYVDDVFSTYLWEGNATSGRAINNQIDLSGKGGLVWIKRRSSSGGNNCLFDTERGAGELLIANQNGAEYTSTARMSAFNSNGFTIGSDNGTNKANEDFASWTFRKAPGFFDVVTYTGNGTSGRTISHSLDGYVGSLWVKCTSDAEHWACWHRYLNGGSPTGYALRLNSNSDQFPGNGYFPSNPSTSNFTVGSVDEVNGNGKTYVAYIFGQDNQVFGENEDQGIIDCSEYTGNGNATGPSVDCGWEPQWVLIKRVDGFENWFVWDSMRGIVTGGNDARLIPNSSGAENDTTDRIDLTSRGFQPKSVSGEVNASGGKYVYIAIRRPEGYVGKPPDAGTDVFAMDAGAGSSTIPNFDSGFPVDFAFEKTIAGGNSWSTGARLIQGRYLYTDTNMAEGAWNKMVFDSNTGWNNHSSYGSGDQSWMWKRHAGFDVVTYTGNGTAGRQFSHSLNKIPEMIWIKNRTQTSPTSYKWAVYHKGLNGGTNPEQYHIYLNTDDEEGSSTTMFNDTAPTATTVTVGTNYNTNTNNESFLAILFSSISGISKVGFYTGSDSAQSINCGFQPRFVILKNLSNNGGAGGDGWVVLDTTRGWGSGNDKVLNLNSGSAQSDLDCGAPTSTGFDLTGDVRSVNKSGRNYIFYAHA